MQLTQIHKMYMEWVVKAVEIIIQARNINPELLAQQKANQLQQQAALAQQQ